VALLFFISISTLPTGALQPGDRAPDWELPWIGMPGSAALGDFLAEKQVTVLVLWNRSCPHCTDVALGVDDLAMDLEPLDAHAVAVIFGPDDLTGLDFLLQAEEIETPHLWDANAKLPPAYGVGIQRLGVFVISKQGIVQAVFDSSIENLSHAVLPSVREAVTHPVEASTSTGTVAAVGMAGLDLPTFHVDGRFRFLGTENARIGDLGLYGEELESGALLLFRWDLRMSWEPVPGIEFVPWLRVSNEDEEILTEGPENFASPRGTASLNARYGPVAGTLGAFPVRISPLLLQRWDDEDAPPLGGVSGCATCGAGASGISQRSLEVLGTDYTLEGLTGSYSHRYGRVRGWLAVPRWEEKLPRNTDDPGSARFRKVLYGGAVDIGLTGSEEPVFGLPTPVGVRLASLNIGDDRRTVSRLYRRPPLERDESAYMAMIGLGPWQGVSADAEYVWWSVAEHLGGDWGSETRKSESDENALRAGVRGRWPVGRWAVWGRVHHIRTDPGFEPLYKALSYESNQEGWRATGGVELFSTPGGSREKFAVTVFYRRVQETEETLEGLGKVKDWIASLTLMGRPIENLHTGIHFVRTVTDYTKEMEDQSAAFHDLEGTGVSVDARWEGWPTVDPMVRVDAIRRDDGSDDVRTVWQGYVSLRVVK
jgi:peroxiredoxin